MGRFYGYVGFLITEETTPGVWEEKIVERPYYGDILKHRFKWNEGEHLNDNVSLGNEFSIVADKYAYNCMGAMKYVFWKGVRWRILSVEAEYPRLRLTIGGEYTGEQIGAPCRAM